MKERGFTIIELMITVAIAGVLVGLGLPALNDFVNNSRARSAANDFATAVAVARSEAIKANKSAYLTPLANSAGDEWGAGWVVWVDKNNNSTRNATTEDVLLYNTTRAVMNQTSGTTGSVQFSSSGVAVNFSGMNVEVARSATAPERTRRVINVSAAGFTSVRKKN